MNFAFILLSILNIVAELIELTYDLGRFTRKYILPVLVWVYLKTDIVVTKIIKDVLKTYEDLVTIEYTLNVRNTPLTTGLAY